MGCMDKLVVVLHCMGCVDKVVVVYITWAVWIKWWLFTLHGLYG